MKLAVIGGAGRQALAAIYDFVEHESVEKILLIDVFADTLKSRVTFLNSDKIEYQIIDALNTEELARALDSYDACLNCTSHLFNLPVMEACVLSRTNYTDLGGLFHWAKKQLLQDERFKKAGITGIVGSGTAPGMVNVMARYAVDRLDSVESVRILDAAAEPAAAETGFVPPYALNTLMDEFTVNNFEFRNGEMVELPPFSGEETACFPDPIGKRALFNMIHSEVATMPVYFAEKGIRNVSFKLALPKTFTERLQFLMELGFGSKTPINVKGTSVVPRDVLIALVEKPVGDEDLPPPRDDDLESLRVIVSGQKEGRSVTYQVESMLHPYEKWNMATGPFSVGFPAAVTTRLLGSGQIAEKGFFSGEAVIDPETYFAELAKRDIRVQVLVTGR